jgi:hypothetical protein
MANPWERYAPIPDDQASGPWTKYAPQDAITPDTPAPAKAYSGDYLPMQPWSGSVLPVSSDTEGRISFDPNAGILGALKNQAISAYKFARGPGDALSGIPAPTGDEAIQGALATAGILSPLNPSVGSVPAMTRAAVEAGVPVPTAAEAAAASNAQYGALRGMGVDYASQPVADFIGTHQRDLVKDGLRDNVAPLTHGVLNDLQKVPTNQSSVMELGALESARQNLGKIAQSQGPEGVAAGRAVKAISDFMANPPEGSVVSGPAEQAAKLVSDARGNWAAKSRSENLTDMSEYADLHNLSTASGNNLENVVRQKVRTLFDPKYPERLAGYTPDEVAELRQIVAGGPIKNAMRWAGNLLGGGGGLGNVAAQTAGSFLGGTPGVIAAATTGPLLKYLGGRGAANQLKSVAEMTRMRSPLYAERLAGADPLPGLLPNVSSVPTVGLLAAQPPQPNDGILSRIWQNPIGWR